jgi:hypothetical protein
MPAPTRTAKQSERLYTRTEARALSGSPDNHALREAQAAGLVAPQRLANRMWVYSTADIRALRDQRRRRGLRVPVVEGFD